MRGSKELGGMQRGWRGRDGGVGMEDGEGWRYRDGGGWRYRDGEEWRYRDAEG